jgi:hypothetical protein
MTKIVDLNEMAREDQGPAATKKTGRHTDTPLVNTPTPPTPGGSLDEWNKVAENGLPRHCDDPSVGGC